MSTSVVSSSSRVLNSSLANRIMSDARLVAAMIVSGVREIVTFNVQDFARFGEITAVDPKTIR